MNKKKSLILLLLLTVCFCVPFLLKDDKNKKLQIQKVEVLNKKNIGTQPVIKVKELKGKYDITIKEMNQKMAEIKSIEDKKEWFVTYKNIIDEYSYILDSPETIYDYFTEDELDLLFHVVQAEIGDEYSFEQKCNVASVIFNRLEHERFPNTLSEILVCDQFSPIADGRYKKVEVSENTILACEYAFMIQDTTNGCLFFDSNNALNYQFVFNDSAHNFYKYREEK